MMILGIVLIYVVISTSNGQYCNCAMQSTPYSSPNTPVSRSTMYSSPSTPVSPGPSGMCGISKYSNAAIDGGTIPAQSIVNGWQARENEFPWQIALLVDGRQFCGGSILSQNYVITAAHCIDVFVVTSRYSVAIGEHRLSAADTNEQFIGIAEIIVHPSYGNSNANSDIAIVRLATPIPAFNENVQPVCMPSNAASAIAGERVTTSGWGDTSFGGSGSDILLYVNLDMIPTVGCQACMVVDSTEVCAGVCGDNHGDACQGDSGGPLVWQNLAGKFELIGLTSRGNGCASSTPGLYTDVYQFSSWIESIIDDDLSYA